MKKTLSLLAVVALIATMIVPMAVSANAVYSAAGGYIAASPEWTSYSLTYSENDGFGDKTNGVSYVEFDVNFGTGYNNIIVTAAEMHATWSWEVLIDGVSQGNVKGEANGQGWNKDVANTATLPLNKTYVGVHTVRLLCVDGGNIHGVQFTNVALPTLNAADGKLAATDSWLYGHCSYDSGSGSYGWITRDTYFAFQMDFGSTGYNAFTVYAAEANEGWAYQVSIDDQIVGTASGGAGGGFGPANATAGTIMLPGKITGVHTVKLISKPNSVGGSAYKGNMCFVEASNVTLPTLNAADGKLAASDSWKYSGCVWDGSTFGNISASTSFTFEMDFGTGYNTFTIYAADMNESWMYQVSIDGEVVGIAGGAPGGGWATSNATAGSLFLPGTVKGKHIVTITALPNNAGNYKGNMCFVEATNTQAFGAMAWGYLPVSEQTHWVSNADLAAGNTTNDNAYDDNCYGNFGDHEKYASALMDFGSAAVDCLFFSIGRHGEAVAKVYIDGAYVGEAKLAEGGSWDAGTEAALELPFALNGVHSVTVTTNSSNLFWIRPHTHDFTSGDCLNAGSCPWCGKVQDGVGDHQFANGGCTVCGTPAIVHQGTSVNEAGNALRFGFALTANGITVDGYKRVMDNATITVNGSDYKLVEFGAIVSNDANAELTLTGVDGKRTKDIPAEKLYRLDGNTAYYACGIKNIPASHASTMIYARSYYIYNDGTKDVVVYGDIYEQNIANHL